MLSFYVFFTIFSLSTPSPQWGCSWWQIGLCFSTLFTQDNTVSLVISVFSCIFVSCQIMSPNMSLSFRPWINCSFVCQAPCYYMPLLIAAIYCCVVPVLHFGIYSSLFLYMFGTWMSRGLVAHLWSCEYWANTVLYSFFGFPLVHTLRWNGRGMCIERTITPHA